MTDLFALLGEPRHPWLDADALKAKYIALTASQHPDTGGGTGADFAEINRAYQTLAEPATRLRHLLDLESGAPLSRTQSVPDEIANYFAPVAKATQEGEAVLKKHSAAASPVAKALLSVQQFTAQEFIEDMLAELTSEQARLLDRLQAADAIWDTDHPAALAALPPIWQSLGYITKWLATLRELLFRLASL